MRKLLLAVLFTLGLCLAAQAPVVLAEEGTAAENTDGGSNSLQIIPQLTVSPATTSVSLKPGASVDYTLVVNNEKSENLDITVYAAPYSIQNEDYDVDFEKETPRTQISRWIEFVNADGSTTKEYKATVPANTKSNVVYRVNIPQDVPAGGQYASIFVQTGDNAKPLETSGLQAVSRVGVVVYGRSTGETEEKADITELSVPTFMLSGPVTASALVTNTGNTDIEASYSFTVKSIVGAELYHSEGKEPVLPDASRRMKQQWENTQPMGLFRVSYQIEILGEVYESSKLVIILPVYMIVLAIFVLTLLIVWIIILVRKRRERKSRLVV
jgi:hypothetical protein